MLAADAATGDDVKNTQQEDCDDGDLASDAPEAEAGESEPNQVAREVGGDDEMEEPIQSMASTGLHGAQIRSATPSTQGLPSAKLDAPQPVENASLHQGAAPSTKPVLSLVPSAPSSTGETASASTGNRMRSSTGVPVLETFAKWKKMQVDKPPCPEGYELDKKGGRKIGRKTYFGYNFLRVESCSECGTRARRPVIGYISATALWRLLQRDYEIQKRLIKIHLSERARRKPYHLSRCAECVARDRSEAIGA